MDLTVVRAREPDLAGAIRVWQAANVARGRPPSALRMSRVRAKLEAHDALVLVGWLGEDLVAMALAEPWRDDNGQGSVVPGRGHVSMVFVHPDRWGHGVGGTLLTELHHLVDRELGWRRTSLWTRETNERARHLYARAGYLPTGLNAHLAAGDRIVELERFAAPCAL
jgi:ribosomal protein S18 acetylase RimI-like enzyme